MWRAGGEQMSTGYITFRFQSRPSRKSGIDESQPKFKFSAGGHKQEAKNPRDILRNAYEHAIKSGDFKQEEEFLHLATTEEEILNLPRNNVDTLHAQTVHPPFVPPMSVGGVPVGYKYPPEGRLRRTFGIGKTANYRICCSIMCCCRSPSCRIPSQWSERTSLALK